MEEKKPETIQDETLDEVAGGYSMGRRYCLWICPDCKQRITYEPLDAWTVQMEHKKKCPKARKQTT